LGGPRLRQRKRIGRCGELDRARTDHAGARIRRNQYADVDRHDDERHAEHDDSDCHRPARAAHTHGHDHGNQP
jgi:hypothetical protein